MRKAFRAMIVALAVLLVAAVPATAADSHDLWAAFEGPTVGFNPDPDAVAARCGDGYGWILQQAGEGEIWSEYYNGPMTFESEHCSGWKAFNPGRATGRIGAGLQMFTTPDGDVLSIAYHGGFTLAGDIDLGEWLSNVDLVYRVVDGTGVFEGAAGHGYMGVMDDSGYSTGFTFGALY